jgi:hypothetical protein
MKNENLTITNWEEYVRPDHVVISLSNGRELKIKKQQKAGGQKAYQTILTLLDNMNSDKRAENAILNLVNVMSNNLNK